MDKPNAQDKNAAKINTPGLPDLVAVVRCRDCKHYVKSIWHLPGTGNLCYVCNYWGDGPARVAPDAFCSWGERRADG